MGLYVVRRTSQTKRSVRIQISLQLLPGAYLSSQRACHEGNCKTGSLPRIPPQIIISHVVPATREQRPGSSKAVFTNSGSRQLSCGSMANVSSVPSPLLSTPLTLIFIAGSGKSVLWFVVSCHCCPHSLRLLLSSAIIEDIKAECEPGSAIMAYFYCDFRDEDKQNCRSLVLSIISQLCTQSNLCCEILSRIYLAHDEGLQKLSTETLKKCLAEMVLLPVQGPIYLIVDALDECPNNSGLPTNREEALDLVYDLVRLCLPNLHICVTSRPEIDIQTILEPLTSLCVSLHDENGQKKDIVNYIKDIVYSDKRMRRWREEDQQLVIETLSERADGM